MQVCGGHHLQIHELQLLENSVSSNTFATSTGSFTVWYGQKADEAQCISVCSPYIIVNLARLYPPLDSIVLALIRVIKYTFGENSQSLI